MESFRVPSGKVKYYILNKQTPHERIWVYWVAQKPESLWEIVLRRLNSGQALFWSSCHALSFLLWWHRMESVGNQGSMLCRNIEMKNSMLELYFHNAYHVFLHESIIPLLVRENFEPFKFKMLANIWIIFNFLCQNFQNWNSKFQSRLIMDVWQSTLKKHSVLSKQDSNSPRLYVSMADLAR